MEQTHNNAFHVHVESYVYQNHVEYFLSDSTPLPPHLVIASFYGNSEDPEEAEQKPVGIFRQIKMLGEDTDYDWDEEPYTLTFEYDAYIQYLFDPMTGQRYEIHMEQPHVYDTEQEFWAAMAEKPARVTPIVYYDETTGLWLEYFG